MALLALTVSIMTAASVIRLAAVTVFSKFLRSFFFALPRRDGWIGFRRYGIAPFK